MRLSQIKLAGFKSFVDPTHISLPGQIVGVVGPNGCGKSNVIDALRWVLGESKASALRGETMQDVIFNGSAKRKPVSRASVELIFDNSLGKAAGQWSSYAEISIKRALQRNGDSSYHINNQHVRRKDITDIFLGTGLGPRAYAIIEQGMISRIIEARPEELRIFLEEAAGVSRYRDRRRETELRINDTRDNLLRVGDILQELAKQLARLDSQAKVAKQYHELEKQRVTTQHLFWLAKKQDAEVQRAGFALSAEKTSSELEAQIARLRDIENRLETARSGHYRLSDTLHARHSELYATNAEIARLEQQIKHISELRQKVTLQISSLTRQGEQQQLQRQKMHELLEHWQRLQEEAAIKSAEALLQAQQENHKLPQAEEAARSAQERCNTLQRELLQHQQRLQLADTQHENLRRNIQQMELRHSRLLIEKDNLPRPDSNALQQVQQQMADLENERVVQQRQFATLQEQLPPADDARRKLRASLQQQELLLAQTEARLHALSQLQQQTGNDKNLNAWLQKHRLEKMLRLWRSIRIDKGWEEALEAVLRERLNAIFLPKLEDAAKWSETPPAKLALFAAETSFAVCPDPSASLRTEGIFEGHATSTSSVQASTCSARTEFENSLTPLLDYVQCQDTQIIPVMRDWLSHVYAAKDVAQACAQRATLPPGGWFVTPAGHLVGAHSVVFHAADSQMHGVLARQREIEKLKQELSEQGSNMESCRQQTAQAEIYYRSLELQVAPQRASGNELQQRLHDLQIQSLRLNQAQERSAERSLQIGREMQELADLTGGEQRSQHEIAEKMTVLREQTAAFHAQVEDALHHVRILDDALRLQRKNTQQAQHALQETNFFARTCAEKITDSQQNIQQIAQALAQLEQSLTQLHSELSDVDDVVFKQQLQLALQTRKSNEQALAEARNMLENATLDLQRLEQERLACELKINPLREKLGELILREQEARLHSEQCAEQLQGVDEQALLLQSGNNKPNSLQNELNRLNANIEALGAVNLAALEELQAATERKTYLDAQAADLNKAMATLEEAIRHIDKESRNLLMDTYNQVNQHLGELFPVLFAGGEARLVLTGDEILDSGVEVIAQPPGKKNSTIHLMSGGEKALTAIALVFSLFRLNPAPFCLLDEVDAPLDDTNTERLCMMIKKMSSHTQFMFISHNKITMEMAQQLIGVTMQEKGVSKVVAVDIEAALRMRDDPSAA